MKRFIVLVMLAIITFSVGCSSEKEIAVKVTTKDTPTSVGKLGTMEARVESFSLDDLVDLSDIIAEVEIAEWRGESKKTGHEKTFFTASLKKLYKNTSSEYLKEIIIAQAGNSDFTLIDYPLFKKNDRLIVFLKKAVNDGDYYWMLGENSSVLKIQKIDNKDYAFKLFGSESDYADIEVKDTSIKSKIKEIVEASLLDYKHVKQVVEKSLLEGKLQ